MRKYILLIFVLVALQLSGCADSPNTDAALGDKTIQYTSLIPDPKAEMILESAFTNTGIAWEAGEVEALDQARNAIKAMGGYLKARLELDSTLPYYTYKYAFEFIVNQYNIIQNILDKRVVVPGAISEEAGVIYYYLKRDINTKLSLQRQNIAQTEKSVDAKASSSSLNDMKDLFTLVKPIVDMIL